MAFIIDVPTRDQYTAAAAQTIFDYTFSIFDQADLVVEQTFISSGVVALLTLSDYAVTGVGVQLGGTIILNTPAASGDIITITREVDKSRITDFSNTAPFTSDNINLELNRMVQMTQDRSREIAQCLRIPDADQNSPALDLPNEVDRAGNVLAFDPLSSQPVAGVSNSVLQTLITTGLTQLVPDPIAVVSSYTPARLIDGNLLVGGEVVKVTDDGIAGDFVVRSLVGGEVDDGGVTLLLATPNGFYLKRPVASIAFLSWFGLALDGVVDDTVAANNAFTFAASAGVTLLGSPGTVRCTASIILKSGLNAWFTHETLWVQDYEFVQSPKNESLFVNEAYDDNAKLDTDIHLHGLNIINDAAILTGSFMSINRCERYSVTHLKATKTSANGTMNINGKYVYIHDIDIDSLIGTLNADGIHFEYLENAVLSDLIIQSQDDCLGFSYFPIIGGNPNNGPAGRDKPSRNITVTNAILSSDIASGIRLGSTTLLGLTFDNQISAAARYEDVTFSNIIFNKVGAVGPCIAMFEVRENMDFPNNNIRFNNMAINDVTSATLSMIQIEGNPFTAGLLTFAAGGAIRNYNRIFFDGISGNNNSTGQFINSAGVQRLSLANVDVARAVATDNEIITNLIDEIYIDNCRIQAVGATGTSNAIFCKDFELISITGTDINITGSGRACLLIERLNLGNGGEVYIDGGRMRGVGAGLEAVSTLVLDNLNMSAEKNSLAGAFRSSNLSAVTDDISPMTSLHANISTSLEKDCTRTNNIAVLTMILTVSGTIASGQTLAQFPVGCKPLNGSSVRAIAVDDIGGFHPYDFSAGAGLRTRSSLVVGRTYFYSLAFAV